MMIAAYDHMFFCVMAPLQHVSNELHVQGVAGEKQEDVVTTY